MLEEEDQAIAISSFEGVLRVGAARRVGRLKPGAASGGLCFAWNRGRRCSSICGEASFFDSTALAELIALYKRLTGEGHRLEVLVGDSNMHGCWS